MRVVPLGRQTAVGGAGLTMQAGLQMSAGGP